MIPSKELYPVVNSIKKLLLDMERMSKRIAKLEQKLEETQARKHRTMKQVREDMKRANAGDAGPEARA